QYGAAARDLYANATDMLKAIVAGRRLRPRGVYGFWPAQSDGNDIVLYTDGARRQERLRFNMLRQQQIKTDADAAGGDKPHLSLADFVAPASSGIEDYVG